MHLVLHLIPGVLVALCLFFFSSVSSYSDLVVGVAKALLTSSFVVKVPNVTTSTKKKKFRVFEV